MKKALTIISALAMFTLSGCSSAESSSTGNTENSNGYEYHISDSASDENAQPTVTADGEMLSDIYVTFGAGSSTFPMHPYNNDTAAELIRNIGSEGKRLPIYDYEGYEGADVFQYYDIPSRFEIPSDPTTVTEEKAGEVYYSAPNRVILFFGDANIEGEYTKVGYFDDSEGFRNAVKNNPVIQGWGNLIIDIRLSE